MKACSASRLIAKLQCMIEEHGDLDIMILDADTHQAMEIGLIIGSESEYSGDLDDDQKECFLITASYVGKPEGYIEPH